MMVLTGISPTLTPHPIGGVKVGEVKRLGLRVRREGMGAGVG